MLAGRVREHNSRISFNAGSFKLDEDVTGQRFRRSDIQFFTAFFKRPPPKTNSVTHRPIQALLFPIQNRLSEIIAAKHADSQICLCSEDLAGIKELVLIPWSSDLLCVSASDFPQSDMERRNNQRVLSQPLQGFGHRPIGQLKSPRRYKLTVIGVNQAGFLSFVHMMLMLSQFRIVKAEIETIRGTYAHNTYEIETYSEAAERVLRTHFQCVVPVRSSTISNDAFPFYHEVPTSGTHQCGVWLDNGLAGYYGRFADGVKQGFGRIWRCSEKQSLASYSYEGDWEDGMESGYGVKLEAETDATGVVKYSFGRFQDGELIDGSVICPYEPPARSLRIDPSTQPDLCVYRVLMQRAEFWRRQLPRNERPIGFIPGSKLRPEYASTLRSSWTLFCESPVPCVSSMAVFQVAALLEMCGLYEAARIAFAKRVDGGLLEAMTEQHLKDILGMRLESQRTMFVLFLSTLSRSLNIDRHMRQPAAVLDALVNPAIGGRLLPLDRMRVVDSLGEGAYGKVIYAEYMSLKQENSQSMANLPKTISAASLASQDHRATPPIMGAGSQGTPRLTRTQSARTPPVLGDTLVSVAPEPSLFSALTRRSNRLASTRVNLYVALKEQVGSGAQLENSCELVREWATLNALPHENIVKLEGICADTNAPMFNKRYLATALVEASLPSLIYNQDGYGPAPELTPLLTMQLAGDIASGLAHMHSLHILHGDIKSPNVLVDIRARDRPIGRLCDFGHAAIRVGPRPQRRMCTFGWASPESLRDAETDTSADVWSWAVVCWEMYVREMPWKACSHAQMVVAVGHCGLDPSGFKGVRMPQRVKAERKMANLCQRCWTLDPTLRPTMERVLHVVDKLGRMSASQAVIQLQSLLQ